MQDNPSVFGIVCSTTPEVRNLKLYATKELARQKLKELADERRYKLGVHWHEETEDMFSYTLGWEEYPVRFSIIEINVESISNGNENPEFPLWLNATNLIAEANMAASYEPETLNKAITYLNSLIGTGYYDDHEGNELMKHMVEYLTGKLGGHD